MITTLLLIIIYISFISLGLPDSLLGSAWPSIYADMSVPVSNAGIISMIIAVGTIISSIFSEKLIKRFGTSIVTVVSVLLTAVALFGFSVSGNFVVLSVCAIPLGLGAGSVDAALNNYVALHYKAKHMSWLHCFWGIGATAGPLVISFCLAGTGSWQMGYRTVSMIQFGLAAILVFSLPLWKKNSGVTAGQEAIHRSSLKFNELLRLPGALQALVSFFCYCGVETTAGLWGSSYLVIVKSISPQTAATWISLYYFGITFGRLLSGFLTVKFNHRQMIRLGQGLIASGIVFLLLPFGMATLLGGFFMIGLGCAPIYPSLLHETPLNFGSEYSQSIMGIQMACAYVGTALMPPFFGIIASYAGYSLFPAYLSLLLIVMVIMVKALNKKVDTVHRPTTED